MKGISGRGFMEGEGIHERMQENESFTASRRRPTAPRTHPATSLETDNGAYCEKSHKAVQIFLKC